MKYNALISTVAGMLLATSAMAQKPFEMPLYSGEAPYDNGDSAKVIVFRAPEKSATGRAVVICPGGGYDHLAMTQEGKDWAPFFNNMGITAVVLKYRMPKGDCRVPIADAEQAMKLVRENADKWKVNRDDVGIMGSSAGGHLATTIATHSSGDAVPNFQILFYPVITMDPGFTHKGSHDNFLGKDAKKKQEKEYSNDAHVTRTTSRAWIALADDDHAVLLPTASTITLNSIATTCRRRSTSILRVVTAGAYASRSLTTLRCSWN